MPREGDCAVSKVWVFQHIHCETLGTIADALEMAGISPQHVHPWEGQPVPEAMGDAAGLIVMGGPMGVYEQDRYPFLRHEIRLIEQALQEEKPVLGVCLGSQLLATALGAHVTKGKKKEIGWHPVTLTEVARSDGLWAGVDPSFMAYHWHLDVFALPRGAVSLASSDLTACQAFRYGRNAYGVLFHMEVTEEIIADMVKMFTDELQETGIDGRGMLLQAKAYLPRLHRIGRRVFRRWAALLEGKA